MTLIYETNNFLVEAHPKPHVDRDDGGHIYISPKTPIEDRTLLSPELAKEVMKLSMVVGEAMKIAMKKQGINFVRVNYQDNGNWAYFENKKPYFHMHLYGRALDAKIQKFPSSLYFPDPSNVDYYKNFKPLREDDIIEIRKEIERIMKTDKYIHF